jgi:uncharacterized protein (TIGR03435 family)
MLQSLLEDRFQLKVRRVTRDSPMYALRVAAKGAKLQPSNDASCTGVWPHSATVPPADRGKCVVFVGRGQAVTGDAQYSTLEGQALSLEHFAHLLGAALGRPVFDKTGIVGAFDIHLKFASDATPGLLGPLYPSLVNIVEEQLGLRLEPFTGPREFLIVDHVAQPILN